MPLLKHVDHTNIKLKDTSKMNVRNHIRSQFKDVRKVINENPLERSVSESKEHCDHTYRILTAG